MLLSLLLIVNGLIPTDARFDAVGRLNWYCTAVLVRSDVILTARHCVIPDIDHVITFRNEEVRVVNSFYFPAEGDAALGYLNSPVTSIAVIPMIFNQLFQGTDIILVGTGVTAETKYCNSWILYTYPTTLIFPPWDDPNGPGCGTEQGDSGGAVIKTSGVVAVIIGSAHSTRLSQYASDPVFNPSSVSDK